MAFVPYINTTLKESHIPADDDESYGNEDGDDEDEDEKEGG